MMNSRAVFAAGAVFLSAALAVSYFQVKEPAVKAAEVLTWGFFVAVKNPQITLRVFLCSSRYRAPL